MSTSTTATAADFPIGSEFTVKGGKLTYTVHAHGEYGSGRTVMGLPSDGSARGNVYFRPDRLVKVTR